MTAFSSDSATTTFTVVEFDPEDSVTLHFTPSTLFGDLAFSLLLTSLRRSYGGCPAQTRNVGDDNGLAVKAKQR